MRAAFLGAIALLAFALATPAAHAATFNWYVATTGNDGNTCDTPFVPCRTFNGALAKVKPGYNFIYPKSGLYASPASLADGGAPSAAEGHGPIDTSLIPSGAFVQIIGSVQALTTAQATVVDAGNVGTFTTTPSQFFVQFAPNVAWSGYMVDAGYAYVDGGLITNALADGTVLSVVAGKNVGLIGPVVGNTVRTINVATHGLVPFTAPTAPNSTSTFTLAKSNTVIQAWPATTDAGHAYASTAVYGVNGVPGTTGVYADNADATLPQQSAVELLYLNIAGAPNGATSTFEAVDNYSGLLDMRYSILALGPSDYGVVNYGGTASLAGSTITGGLVGALANSGQLWLTGDYLTGQATYGVYMLGGANELAGLTISPAAGASAVDARDARFNANGLNISMGNTTQPTFFTANTTASLADVTSVSDGGAGTYRCGAGGRVRLQGTNSFGLANLFSGDNGVTWVSATTFSTQDGGSGGVHSDTNLGTGCGYSNY